MIAPQTSQVESQVSTYTIKATIENIDFPSQVVVKVNGQSVTNGFYNVVTRVFTKDISLTPGSNNVTLTVTSDCGTVNSSFIISYTVPQIDNNITICFKGQQLVIKESQWAAYQSQGATKGDCPPVVDNNITICFKGRQLVIKESQWASYQSQGATKGDCPEVDKDLVICFKGNTMTIKESQWITYQKQGAKKGECRTPVVDLNITICFKGQEMVIKESQWATYEGQGATRGKCPEQEAEQMITICHTNPNDPDDKQTIEIPISEWPAHQAHGDTQGQCAEAAVVGNDEMVICHNGVTKIIKKIEWIQYRMQGATEGECN